MRINIVVQLEFEGKHHWDKCPHYEVEYLKNTHRHIFHITCKKTVNHDDRDIEIIMFKNRIEKYLKQTYPTGYLANTSCEQLAVELINHFELCYCQVLEDGENGAEVWNG